jgi:acetyl esterase/lipase
MASALLLVLGVAALLGTVNALRPSRATPLLGASWISAWIAVELAPHLVVLSGVAAVVLVLLGGLDQTIGWIGLGCLVVADAIAIPMIIRAIRTSLAIEEVVADLDPDEPASRYPRIQIALPFLVTRRKGVERRRGITYTNADGPRIKLDVYSPSEESSEPRPAIVQVHGGGWILGSRREQGIPLLTHLAANGWVGFNVDYRLSPRHTWPAQIVDVKRAIAWVREHAGEYGADPDCVAITGGSAGGHLSALAALTAGDPDFQPGFEDADTSVAACVPFYGVYDMVDEDAIHIPAVRRVLERLVFKTSRRRHPERFRAASPIYRVTPDAPPFFVIHGQNDSLIPVEEAHRFVTRLREVSQSPVLYAEMKGGQHAFDVIPSWRTVPVLDAIERFLRTVRQTQGQPAREEPALQQALTGRAG